jgi:hypothetical protein
MLLIIFLAIIPLLLLGQNSKPIHPSLNRLNEILIKVINSSKGSTILQRDLDSILSIVVYDDKIISQTRQYTEPDSLHYKKFLAFNKLASYSKYDKRFIRTIILLEQSISTDVELAESMPDYVQIVAQDNIKGFVDVFASLKTEEQERVISALGWPSDIDIKNMFLNYAKQSKNQKHKAIAKYIATEVNDELIQNK